MANWRPRFLQPLLASALLTSATPALALQTIDAEAKVAGRSDDHQGENDHRSENRPAYANFSELLH